MHTVAASGACGCRRAFVLIGSSLFYARTHDGLLTKPQLFAQLYMCEVLPWADYATTQQNVFGVHCHLPLETVDPRTSASSAASDREPELLLIAADSGREKFEWMHAIEEARTMQCSV